MQERNRISSVQLLFLLAGSRILVGYSHLPILSQPPGNQDSWIAVLLSGIYSLVICLPVLYITNKLKTGITFHEFHERVYGKTIGKAVSLAFALFFAATNLFFILFSTNFINLTVLKTTPLWAILLFMLLPVAYLAWKGAGVIGRVSCFIVPYVFITIIFFFLVALKNLDFTALQPILADSSFQSINGGAFFVASLFSEILMFPILASQCVKEMKIKKVFISSLVIFVLMIILIVIPVICVLGVDIAQRVWNPYYFFTRQVDAYEILQRMESLNLIGWFMAILLKLSVYTYMSAHLLSGVFKTKTHKPFVPAILAVLFVLSLVPIFNNYNVLEQLKTGTHLAWVSLIFILLIPLVTVLVYLLRRKKISLKPAEDRTA